MKRQESSIRKMIDTSERRFSNRFQTLRDYAPSYVRNAETSLRVRKACVEKVQDIQQSTAANPVVEEAICLTVPHTKRRRRGVTTLSQTTDTTTIDDNAARVASLMQKTGLTREKQNLFLIDDFF